MLCINVLKSAVGYKMLFFDSCRGNALRGAVSHLITPHAARQAKAKGKKMNSWHANMKKTIQLCEAARRAGGLWGRNTPKTQRMQEKHIGAYAPNYDGGTRRRGPRETPGRMKAAQIAELYGKTAQMGD